MKKRKIRVASLFSGCGGFDLPFHDDKDFEIVFTVEIDESAVRTYIKNLGWCTQSDIRQIPSSAVPDCDVVIGGFPCGAFSKAGKKRGLKDKGQGLLYKEFVRIVRDKKPPIFIAENVPGILFVNKGEAIKTIKRDFSRQGYRVQHKKLSAAEHGVPQTRERVFIVGVRKDVDVDFIYPEPTHGSDLEPFVTVRDVLEALKS